MYVEHVSLVWIARRKKPKGIYENSNKKIEKMVGVARRNIHFLCFFFYICSFLYSIHTRCPSHNFGGKRMSVFVCVQLCCNVNKAIPRTMWLVFQFGTKLFRIQHILFFADFITVLLCIVLSVRVKS